MTIYQVRSKFDYPASNEVNDLCIFGSLEDAKEYIESLKEYDSVTSPFSIVQGTLTLNN